MALTYAEIQRRRRARLAPFLEQLRHPDESILLDLCELVLMEAEKMDGGFTWDHPRCVVFIRTRKRTRKFTTRKLESR